MKVKALVLAAAVGAAMSLAGCMNFTATYANASNYTAGERDITETITELDLNWSAGKVTVTTNSTNTITVRESCDKSLDDDERVHTWVDGKTLHVQFCESGKVFMFGSKKKELEISIPKDIKLSGLSYDGSSADARFENLSAESISLDSSSGDVKLIDCTAETVDADTSSGNIELDIVGNAKSIKCDASSGNVTVKADGADDIDVDTSSGDIEVDVKTPDKVITDASSGDTKLTFGAAPSSIKHDSSSGDFTLYLPESAEFKAEIDTSSGKFETDFGCEKDDDTYTCGSGSNVFSIDTSSGDVSIKKN